MPFPAFPFSIHRLLWLDRAPILLGGIGDQRGMLRVPDLVIFQSSQLNFLTMGSQAVHYIASTSIQVWTSLH